MRPACRRVSPISDVPNKVRHSSFGSIAPFRAHRDRGYLPPTTGPKRPGVGGSEFCRERGLPHPGFLVLDTPMLTFRDPLRSREGALAADEEAIRNTSLKDFFFEHLSRISSFGQFIVVENVDLPEASRGLRIWRCSLAIPQRGARDCSHPLRARRHERSASEMTVSRSLRHYLSPTHPQPSPRHAGAIRRGYLPRVSGASKRRERRPFTLCYRAPIDKLKVSSQSSNLC
jgi:hypothetical protein